MLLYPRHTLPTAAAPVVVAAALAAHAHRFAAAPAGAAFLAGWLIQLGGVIADNYHNLVRHGDDREHADFVRALKGGVVTLRELKLTIAGCFAGAAVAGAYLMTVGGLPVLAIGLVSAAAALAYSAGPFPLGDHGFGDILFFTFFGFVSVTGAYYVQARTISEGVVVASLAIGALTTNILLIDNLRDLDFDREKHERTLAVIIGPRWTRVEFVLLQVFAFCVPVWLYLQDGFGLRVLLPLLSLPYAVIVTRRVLRLRTYESLLPMTPQQGQVLLVFSALLAAGVA